MTEPGLAADAGRSVSGCLAALFRRGGLGRFRRPAALRGFGRLFRRRFLRLRRFACKVVFLFLVGFEIGLVPAAARQAKRRRGHLTLHGGVLAAVRTDIGIGIGQLLQALELFAAVAATEHVDGHLGKPWNDRTMIPPQGRERGAVYVGMGARLIMRVFAKGSRMHLRTILLAAFVPAAACAASAALAAAPLCPATWPAQPATSVAHINEVNRGLGIPTDYAARHNLVPLPEGKDLVQVPHDVYGRKVEMVAPAAAALKQMFAAAARDGVKLETVSGFRSINYQTGLIRR